MSSAEQHLMILQQVDGRRRWHSLDDQRICVLCHQLITGRDVRITPNGAGSHDLRCPTEGCTSGPVDWYYYGSAQSPTRPAAQAAPQRVEMDLDLF